LEVLREKEVGEQIKNVGVLHKLVKGLERLVEIEGIKVKISDHLRDRLVECSEIEDLPVKTVKRINDLLGTVCDVDYVKPNRYEETLTVPVTKFPTVDWCETLLGKHGQKVNVLEDEYDVRIRLLGTGSAAKHQVGPLRIKISSLNRWNLDLCRDRVHKLLFIESSRHMQKQKKARKVWQQVLDEQTLAFYYWNVESNSDYVRY